MLSVRFARITRGTLNSAMTWRQAPHGEIGTAVSATTANMTKSRTPAATAAQMAVRSAHWVNP